MKLIQAIVVLLACAMFFAGCNQSKISQKSVAFVDIAIPVDARLVTGAIEAKLRGVAPEGVVSFASGVGEGIAEPEFKYEDFIRTGTSLYSYTGRPDGKEGVRITGFMDFEAPSTRKTSTLFVAEYVVKENAVNIQSVSVAPMYASRPELEVYIVPKSFFSANYLDSRPSWEKLYETVTVLDVLRDKSSDEVESEATENLVFAFAKNRIAPDAKMTMYFAKKKTLPIRAGWSKGSRQLKYDGWDVCVSGGKFSLAEARAKVNTFIIKVTLAPGSLIGGSTQVLVNANIEELSK